MLVHIVKGIAPSPGLLNVCLSQVGYGLNNRKVNVMARRYNLNLSNTIKPKEPNWMTGARILPSTSSPTKFGQKSVLIASYNWLIKILTRKKAGTIIYTAAYNLKNRYPISRNLSNTAILITSGKNTCINPKRKKTFGQKQGINKQVHDP